MKPHRSRLPARPARMAWTMLLAVACLACPSRGSRCPAPGAEGCECTTAGACDTGLTCSSGVCLSGPVAPGDPGVAAAALSPSTIVFIKRLRRAEDVVGGRKTPRYASHLYALDLKDRSERVISTLDDNGTDAYVTPDFSVSPDRRFLAFTSRDFRFTPADRANGYRGGIVWSVTMDGKSFRRLTPPTQRRAPPGSMLQQYRSVDYRQPLWSKDPDTVYFEEYQGLVCPPTVAVPQACNFSKLRAVRSVSRAEVDTWNELVSGCISEAPLSMHPTLDLLLLSRGACRPNSSEGLYEMTPAGQEPPTEKQRIRGPTGLDHFDIVNAAYLPDGSGVLIVAAGSVRRTTVNPEGIYERIYRQGVYLWTEGSGTKALYEPPGDDLDVADITITKAGQAVVEMIHVGATREQSHLHLFDAQTGQLGDQLTRTEDNIRPRW